MAHESTPETGSGTKEHLQDLVLDSSDVEDFLHELAVVAAAELSSPGQEVFCGVPDVPPGGKVGLAGQFPHRPTSGRRGV